MWPLTNAPSTCNPRCMEKAFDKNDRAAIEAALADAEPGNPLAEAVARGIEEFSKRLADQAKRTGHVPGELLIYRPVTAFDDIVIRLTIQAIAEEMGREVRIHWLPPAQNLY